MAVASAQVSVTTTATEVATPLGDTGGAGQDVLVKNPTGGATVYLGGSGVTTSNGFPLEAGAAVTARIFGDDILYGRVASGTQTVYVLRVGT